MEDVEAELEKMLKLGTIKKSKSPYSIPIVPVFKENGEVRLCLDARKINEKNIPDRECLTAIETILAKFNKVKFMSTLDLRYVYWQIPLAKESQNPCSFPVIGRNYSYKRMPFGLNISGSEFQKCMDYYMNL